MSYKKLKESLRDVSFSDRMFSFFFKYPLVSSKNCDIYDQWLSDFLDDDVEVVSCDKYNLKLLSKKGVRVNLWVSNYPASYGNRQDIDSCNAQWGLYPSWKNIFKIRKLQLRNKDEVLSKYRLELTKN